MILANDNFASVSITMDNGVAFRSRPMEFTTPHIALVDDYIGFRVNRVG